jgi:hypothetical protein
MNVNRALPATVGEHRLPSGHFLRRLQILGLVLGLGGLAVSYMGYQADRVAFLHAYLVVFLFYLGFALGPLGILGLNYVTGGRWGVVLRRPLEAAASTLPIMVLLFVPIVFGMHDLYEWTHTDEVAKDVVLSAKAGYLNEHFFFIRAAVYFVVWALLAFGLIRLSHRQDQAPGEGAERRLQFMGRITLVLYALTMTFAAVDWAMSVDPHWYSTIYGVKIIGGQILTAFAFTVAVSVSISRDEKLSKIIVPARLHDLGNLMLAFVMLWAYFELSQFLIIWSGNLPEETPFYLTRSSGAWKIYTGLLVLFQFVVPFVALLSRPVKRNPGTLAAVALLVLVMRCADLYWMITPTFQTTIVPPLVFPALIAGIGGIWLVIYVWRLSAYPLLPVSDTSLLEEE